MNKTTHTLQVGVTDAKQCMYCGSAHVRFVDFDRIDRRLDNKRIAVTEIWMCRACGKEFQRLGTLYSPEDLNKIRLRTAMLSWGGYFAGTMLGYTLYFHGIM